MDEQLYIMGLGLSLEEKIRKAIGNLQLYEPEALRRDPVNGYYLCDSYGKDSGVILHLAKASGVKFVAHHNLTTLDPPELIMHGRKNHPETIIHRPKMAMLTRLAREKTALPTRLCRWCCAEYKENSGSGMVKVFGVRASESARRKASWKIWTPHRGAKDCWILNPILYWSDENVWQYTRKNNIPYCCLYDEGWDRLGCIGCPMADKQRRRDFAKWPRYEQAWRRAITMFWERMHSTPRLDGGKRFWEQFKSPEEHWSWWMEEMPKEDDENDCQMGLF
jgi:phosphoadenosine phosphosulfate reductase